ncbi:MAG: hypothetical protein JO147_04180 [Actinobacteria bacterium]|nr:hypothetical protein [Actinomycetota bacterium]
MFELEDADALDDAADEDEDEVLAFEELHADRARVTTKAEPTSAPTREIAEGRINFIQAPR